MVYLIFDCNDTKYSYYSVFLKEFHGQTNTFLIYHDICFKIL
jgi:hypothetical protein